jgi:hypothetical protein
VSAYEPPAARERLAILRSTRSIAIVGMSADPSRASFFVATYLTSSSCAWDDVWFVSPRGGEVLDRPLHPSLADLPGVPDLVVVFRKSDDLPAVAQEVIALGGTATFWAQLGLWSDEAADIVERSGRRAVMNRCVKIEHARFAGGLHLAGFDTGVITARRTIA